MPIRWTKNLLDVPDVMSLYLICQLHIKMAKQKTLQCMFTIIEKEDRLYGVSWIFMNQAILIFIYRQRKEQIRSRFF